MKPPKITYFQVFFNTRTLGLLILIIVAILSLLTAVKDFQNGYDLITNSISSQAKVTDHSSSTDSDNKTKYSITYTYKDAAEHHFSDSVNITEADWNQFREGDVIRVEYSKKDHSVSRLPGDQHWFNWGFLWLLFALSWTPIIAYLMVIDIKRNLKRYHIYERGLRVVSEANPKMVAGTDSDGNESNSYSIDYVYFDSVGKKLTGVATISKAEYEAWKNSVDRGNKDIEIFYDPENPVDNLVAVNPYNFVLVRAKPLNISA